MPDQDHDTEASSAPPPRRFTLDSGAKSSKGSPTLKLGASQPEATPPPAAEARPFPISGSRSPVRSPEPKATGVPADVFFDDDPPRAPSVVHAGIPALAVDALAAATAIAFAALALAQLWPL